MKYIKSWLPLFVAVLIVLLSAVTIISVQTTPSLAASEIVLGSTVNASFPDSIVFNVSAKSDSEITLLRLRYTVEHQTFADVFSESVPEFTPSTSVDTKWVWDMRKSNLPVGARIHYWWIAEDASGKKTETTHNLVTFDDSRYDWNSITEKPVTIFWYKGDKSFADALMGAATEGLSRIENDTGAVPQGNVRIYIYASANELRGAQLFSTGWEGGVSYTGFDIIAIAVGPDELDYGLTAVPHELTHWIIGQVTFNNYGAGLPVWLNEGLATYSEGDNSYYQSILNAAIKNNHLISIRSLSSPFSAIPTDAYISYGESNSVVTFLIQEYGKEKMKQLLDVFRQGSGYDEALQTVYGFDQDGLDALWRKSLETESTTALQN